MENFTAFGSFKPHKNQGGSGDVGEMNLERFDTVPEVKMSRGKISWFSKEILQNSDVNYSARYLRLKSVKVAAKIMQNNSGDN